MDKRKIELIKFRKDEMMFDQHEWFYIPNTNKSLIINKEGVIVETNNYRILNIYIKHGYKKVFHQYQYLDYDRLIAETFIPHPIHKNKLIHIDGDRLNNDISNLKWVSNNYSNLKTNIINLFPKKPNI